MSTIANIIDRLYRDWLDPSGEAMLSVPLETTITDSELTLVHEDGFLRPNELDLIEQGIRLEIDLEILRSDGYDATTRTVDIKRSQLGTTAAAHTAGDYIYINPDISKVSVFDAVADAIEDLYPDLAAIKNKQIITSDGWSELADSKAQTALRGMVQCDGRWEQCPVRIITGIPDSSTTVVVQFPDGIQTGLSGYVTYRAKFTRPTALADTFTDLGIEESWMQPIMVGALMGLALRHDLDASTVELVTEALDQAGFPTGSGDDLHIALRRWHQALIDMKKRTQHQEWPIPYERDGYTQ